MIDKTQYKFKNLIKWAIAALLMIPLLQIIYIGWVSIYQNNMPITHWLEYDRFESTSNIYMADEPLTMRSFYKTNRSADMSYLDVLYCETDDGVVSYSEQTFKRQLTSPIDARIEGKGWVYTSHRPRHTANCYIGSTITLHLEYAEDKKIKRESNVFVLDCRQSVNSGEC